MKPFLDPFPFRTPENRSSIGDVISEITSRGEQPKGKGYAKVEKIPAPIPPSKSGKRYDKAGKVTESHTRTQLEKLSTTELRELKKKYERLVLRGDRKASEELATVRGLLRSKGAGVVVDEGVLIEGGVKAALHDFMEGLPAKAVAALRPVMDDPSIRGGTLRAKVGAILKRNGVPSMVLGGSSAQIVIDNWDTFHGTVSEATEGDLHGGGATSPPPRKSKTIRTPRVMPVAEARKGIRKTRYGQALQRLGDAANRIKANPPKPPVNPFKKPVQEASECEQAAMARLKAANAADLKDKPGAAGKAAHKRLHKTIGKVLKGK